MRVAVVGATGLVGRLIVRLLEERDFPADEVTLFASRGGRRIPYRGQETDVQPLHDGALHGFDLILSSTPDRVALEQVPVWLDSGARVIDESAAWRRSPQALLAVAGVNDHRVDTGTRLLAGPNCTTTQLALALAPVQRAFGIEELVISTYQSASGAGSAGLAHLRGELEPGPFDRPLAGDLIPAIGREDGGTTSEEEKLLWELPRLLEAEFAVHATCVRVPVEVGHAASVWIRTRSCPTADPELFTGVAGVRSSNEHPGPRAVVGTDDVIVSRLRRTGQDSLALWCVADNLRVGAALNAVRLAELLVRTPGHALTGEAADDQGVR